MHSRQRSFDDGAIPVLVWWVVIERVNRNSLRFEFLYF